MLNPDLAEKILDYGMSHGGDFVEIFMEDTRQTNLTMLGDELIRSSVGKLAGIGIRVFRNMESIYFHTENESEAHIFALMKKLLNTGKVYKRSPLGERIDYAPNGQVRLPVKFGIKEQLSLLNRCNQAGIRAVECIFQMRTNYVDMDQKVQIINTEGVNVSDRRIKTRLHITAYAKDGDMIQSSYIGPGAMGGFEFYEMINAEEYAVRVAREAKAMLPARPCPTGRLPVVIANGFGGLLFHEACGHSLEAAGMLDGASEFSGRIGQKVAPAKVTLIDDGSIPGEWGSLMIDDEGNETRKNVLIDKGILQGCLSDRLSARRMGTTVTGSGRRENYQYPPVSRMTNTFIAAGDDRPEDMIASIEKGIYVKNINGGSVNTATGQFNFNTMGTYLIEQGEITVPVHSATLIGTGSEILQKIEMVGSDFKLGQGYCFAGSGTVYVGAGQPTVKIREMTVGGEQV